jgi:succinyl-CoA:acetate CoA-transferase
MRSSTRVANAAFAAKICSAEDAATTISDGDNIGMSGFTGGYPKAVPAALVERIVESAAAGRRMRVGVWTGASTAPELDGALADVDGIELRLPYQSDPVIRAKINSGRMEYIDIHLSQVAQRVWEADHPLQA